MQQQVCDAEMRLAHTTELYTKEKIEKENNAVAFKRILETYLLNFLFFRIASSNKKQQYSPQSFHTSSIAGIGFPSLSSVVTVDQIEGKWKDNDIAEEATLEHIQRLEQEFALKEQEIQVCYQFPNILVYKSKDTTG